MRSPGYKRVRASDTNTSGSLKKIIPVISLENVSFGTK